MRKEIFLGKSVSKASNILKRSGSTWPGHMALKIDANLISNILKLNPDLSIVLVAGTNGKTTTTKLIQDVLETQGKKVFRNETGANLINGITSTFIKHSSLSGIINYDTSVFEIDESSLPLLLSEFSKTKNKLSILLLNLFRDQLDRYGEVNGIAKKWLTSLQKLPPNTVLVTNGDDPMLRFIGENSNLHAFYFGLSEKYMKKMNTPHDVDFLFCPHCGTELDYAKRSYSHMGIYKCPKCKFEHKKTATFEDLPNPMFGIYNKYNINAATLLLQKTYGIDEKQVLKTLEAFAPAFGRQEITQYKNKKVFMLLSKNPTGFNQSIQAILEQNKNPNILLLLNDRIPDGRDISWIWDVEFEEFKNAKHITISGDRAYDMGLRIQYAEIKKFEVIENLTEAINTAVSRIDTETLYVLTTYSAMLEARKIITGKSIL